MNKKKSFTFMIALLGCLLTSMSAYSFPTNVVIFGDSLSDLGNNNWIYATGTPITSLDKNGNKFIWGHYLSENLFKRQAFFSSNPKIVNLIDSVFVTTVSYAYASADTGNTYLNADWPNITQSPSVNPACTKPGLIKNSLGEVQSACVPGLLQQVELYLKDVHQQPNKNRNRSHQNNAYIIWGGANDIFYNLTPDTTPEKIEKVIKTAIQNIVAASYQLIDHGISPRQIYVVNLPDLSKTPFAIKHSLNLTALTIGFNQYLQHALTTTDQKHAGVNIISLFDLLNQITETPSKFNFSNISSSCIEDGKVPLCEAYLFYDLKHPTAAGHKVIADFISEQIK